MKINEYFEKLKIEVDRHYMFAEEARAVGIDPVSKVEVAQASSLAEKVVGLVSTLYPQVNDKKIVNRILDLEKEFGSLDPGVSLKIAEEISKEKFCKFESHHQAIEAGIRIALAYMTLGVVSSPIEGFVRLKLNKTSKGEDYFAPFYSGPIRSAGGTEAAFSLVVIDYLRELLGYSKYDPSEEEVKRGVHECYEYHERITNLQYLPSEEELTFLMENLPIQISGDPSEKREVYNHKDLNRVETNFIRSGFTLVIAEGMAQKAPKILKRISKLKEKGFKLSNWDWLEDFVKLQKKLKEKIKKTSGGATYIQDIVAGRPVFGHPGRSGAFRLRYGRCRNTGYSTLALNPATMAATKDFIAIGTQLKIEKPTKGCTIASCDTIDGPFVKLSDGTAKYLKSVQEVENISEKIEEIIYLGDLLVPYGDFINRNHPLTKPAYVEQYWQEELKKAGGNSSLKINFEKALELSDKFKVPLHPSFIFYWTEINFEEFTNLLNWISKGIIKENFILPYAEKDLVKFENGKRSLELLGCEHEMAIEKVIIKKENAKALLFNLGIAYSDEVFRHKISKLNRFSKKSVLEIINDLCKFKIKNKAGTFIGARMGRPEKAKLRKLVGSPHTLFPVGVEGGRLKSVFEAVEKGSSKENFPLYECSSCKNSTIYPKCEKCGEFCKRKFYSYKLDQFSNSEDVDNEKFLPFKNQRIDIKHFFEVAKKKLGFRIDDLPLVVKGLKKTSSKGHDCENLAKGLLRAKYNLNVNKDGTVRYDISEMPLTHFKPKEIGTSVEKLKELGYEKDINNSPLENDNQILEIFPHDVVLPACKNSPDEMADEVLLNITNFVDHELEKLYDKESFFKFKNKKELAGTLIGCMAPHNCAAVVGRVIGFANIQALLASPYMHAAMRRDCDGDEACIILLMDLLLNFSKKFLPSHRGGTQDAPLVLNTRMRAGEVDDMVFDLDISKKIPLELFKAAEEEKSPYEIKMDLVKDRLGGKHEFEGIHFSYDTSDINLGPSCSSYKTLPTMKDKLKNQMILCKKIRAVDTTDVARLVIERHLIRDIKGNFRKFSMQVFRCTSCNSKYRRPPLVGKCTNCGGNLMFTISKGSILKYLDAALELAIKYNVSSYLLECLEIVKKDIESVFGREKEKQENLAKWF